ncbi:hypothetical protein IW261DRAFT_1562992 [Armillaria novae-zelandiae]|uniref:Armadillo-like helical domain-containing protein n=1 Tax=Armillaria novae-zelandiae TaxID=153914 RepID=A0AA39PDQ1_9AGAR|nr:hypothetical protein IW261DRAFT_1562992 [Armillaria novae-zelandiae]
MDTRRRNGSIAHSKFVSIYSQLLQGTPAAAISPNEDSRQFTSNLLILDVNRDYLEAELRAIPKDVCLGPLKRSLNDIFSSYLNHVQNGVSSDDLKTSHALETLCIFTKCLLTKGFSGWEVMEVFAGGVGNSDAFFMDLVTIIDDSLANASRSAAIRHQILQLGLIFMCGISQLSPGAYFLRRNLFPSIVAFIKGSDTEQYTFEAVLFLAVLADFHKSDAARLNPYLSQIKETRDIDLMKKICWAANFALIASTRRYQEISDDDVSPALASTFGTLIASLRPDRALSTTPVDPPRELFKNQPIEATIILLPLYEFLRGNVLFSSVFLNSNEPERTIPSPSSTLLTLSSYLLTHATSTSQPRSAAYANLCINCLLALVETDAVLVALSKPNNSPTRLCRQRLPMLPIPRSGRPLLCALLDCCVLWLRHNLHMRLEVHLYTRCIWVCHRVVFYLQKARLRLEYEWKELWSAILGLLHFLAAKLDNLVTTGGVEQLIRETIFLLSLCLSKCETFLPTPQTLHDFVYELVRAASDLQSQAALLKRLASPESKARRHSLVQQPTDLLMKIVTITQFYEQKVTQSQARTAKDALRAVSREIEANGLYGLTDSHNEPKMFYHFRDTLAWMVLH